MSEIKILTQELTGTLIEIECKSDDSVLIFQLPHETRMMSKGCIDSLKDNITQMLPKGRKVVIIGNDINIYELAAPEFLSLRLKGLL